VGWEVIYSMSLIFDPKVGAVTECPGGWRLFM